MASIKKLDSGKWRVSVKVGKERPSKVFEKRADAVSWGQEMELKLHNKGKDNSIDNFKQQIIKNLNADANLQGMIEKMINQQLKQKEEIIKKKMGYTFADAVKKYINEVLPTKRGNKTEHLRLMAYWRMFPDFYDKKINDITKLDIIKIRNERLKSVATSSVARELTIISAVFEIARKEWDWINYNPVHDVKRPPVSPHRDRIISRAEIKAMLRQMKWKPNQRIFTLSQSLACAFRLSLRTGMRVGELCNMRWEHVYDNYVYLPITKNGKSRKVPLTFKSKRIINSMQGFEPTYVFALKPNSLTALFRKYRKKAKLNGFRFHDARHTAATWMAQSLKSKNVSAQQAVMDLCKIFGWTNISQSLIYYNPSINDIIKRLE